MVQYLEELQGVATAPLNSEELIELEQLRVKYEQLKKRSVAGPAMAVADKKKKKP